MHADDESVKLKKTMNARNVSVMFIVLGKRHNQKQDAQTAMFVVCDLNLL